MTTLDPAEIASAIADDLNGIVDLPEHLDWRNAEPDGLSADNAPWLAVWPSTTTYELVAVDGESLVYRDVHTISVEWAEALHDIEAINLGTTTDAADIIANNRPIVDQLRTYGATIPGATGEYEGTLAATSYSTREGGVLTARTTLTVATFPG